MDTLTGPDSSTFGKIAAVGLPLAAGVAAAATPGGARGLAGATNVVNTMAALRDLSQRQQTERAFGQRLSDILGQPSGPPTTTTSLQPGRDENAPEFLPEPTKTTTPAPTIAQKIGGPQADLIRLLASTPGHAANAATMLAQGLGPEKLLPVPEGGLYSERTGKVVVAGQPKPHPTVVTGVDENGNPTQTAYDLNKIPSGTRLPAPVASTPEERAAQRATTPEGELTNQKVQLATTARAEAEAKGKAQGDPERRRLELAKLALDLEQQPDAQLPANVRAELQTPPIVALAPKGRGVQIQAALQAIDERETAQRVEAAKQTGVNAAQVPQRTPETQLQALTALKLGQSYLGELNRLAPKVDLTHLVGGLRPWMNQAIETGRVGPIPIPSKLVGTLNSEQERFLVLLQDYADTVLRLRSGAQINEQEFQRMLGFLGSQVVRPEMLLTRLQVQGDLLKAREDAIRGVLTESGYRAPKVTPPDLAPPSTAPPESPTTEATAAAPAPRRPLREDNYRGATIIVHPPVRR